jgi:ribosomal-protein-alanine N-acetyltransferase
VKTFDSHRLLFRPFQYHDADLIYTYLQEKEIIDNTLSIPYPYEKGMAQEWISMHEQQQHLGDFKFAVVLKAENILIGAIEIVVNNDFQHGVLGYWLAKPYWNQGYATEALGRIIQFGFEDLDLHKIVGEHFDTNPSSGRVMEKNGMQLEGKLRQHKMKWGEFVNIDMRGILKPDWKIKY